MGSVECCNGLLDQQPPMCLRCILPDSIAATGLSSGLYIVCWLSSLSLVAYYILVQQSLRYLFHSGCICFLAQQPHGCFCWFWCLLLPGLADIDMPPIVRVPCYFTKTCHSIVVVLLTVDSAVSSVKEGL